MSRCNNGQQVIAGSFLKALDYALRVLHLAHKYGQRLDLLCINDHGAALLKKLAPSYGLNFLKRQNEVCHSLFNNR